MAEDRRSRGPRYDHNEESQYPPPPGEDDERSRSIAYHNRSQMASGAVTLPSIQDPRGYPAQGGQGWDPRASSSYGTSPNSSNGFSTESSTGHQGSYSPASTGGYAPPHGYLPPVQPSPPDARGSYPPDPRGPPYYSAARPAPYGANAAYDFAYRPDRGPPGQYPQQVMQPSAPRQRTSIACRYCRRRKIRCSGYANSPGGKCTNCIKMNQECIFQPVSSSTSTAFVPVSALQNGIPPGTQLFGAYGQPLSGPSNAQPGGGPYSAGPPGYDQPLPSPTGSFNSYPEERGRRGVLWASDARGRPKRSTACGCRLRRHFPTTILGDVRHHRVVVRTIWLLMRNLRHREHNPRGTTTALPRREAVLLDRL
ncbi:uncharacterized protein PG998_012650 [Apiospora kogelbergensis]|uniref:Zn(2)-C6 fungal-type domain-containing protein n=1 Tax=Apiospora kogelbergensis TaxID=1337665 RepID=A0AAW0QUR6_9PEZI